MIFSIQNGQHHIVLGISWPQIEMQCRMSNLYILWVKESMVLNYNQILYCPIWFGISTYNSHLTIPADVTSLEYYGCLEDVEYCLDTSQVDLKNHRLCDCLAVLCSFQPNVQQCSVMSISLFGNDCI